MKVLSVDVGFQVCGYTVCQVNNLDVTLIKEGEIRPPASVTLGEKLAYMYDTLSAEIAYHEPEAMVIETLYSHHRHPTTMGLLAQVRGVIVLLARQKALSLYEYAPTRARKSFLGKGSVNSLQVKKMAENVTGRAFRSIHTADAFSLVVAFSHTQKLERLQAGLARQARSAMCRSNNTVKDLL